jgi:Macrocin-O-methyltransferase (TylF)
MSAITRSINRALGQTVGIQISQAQVRPVVLSSTWFARLVYFNGLIDKIAAVDGDVVECGVADGASLAILASLLKVHGQTRRVWGFDSWAGLPAPSGADLGGTSIAVSGMFSQASTAKVRDELLAYGLTSGEIAKTVKLVPGLFSGTLPDYKGHIALLHVDVDLYQSYLDCLANLWPHVLPGGIVAFDEYGEDTTWPGARRAVDEFLATVAVDPSEMRRDQISGKWWIAKTDG